MTPKGLLRLKQAIVEARGARGRRVPAGARRPRRTTASACGGSCSAPARSTTTSSATRSASTRLTSRSRGSSSSIRSRSRPPRLCVVATRSSRRSSGRRRSRRTWAPGARSGTGSRTPRPTASACGYVGPAVAREPERGLSDGAPARAGPHRPRGARQRSTGLALRLAVRRAAAHGGAPSSGCGEARAVTRAPAASCGAGAAGAGARCRRR